MSSVTFDADVGGDGSTVTDGTDANGLAGPTGRGYKTKFIPACTNIVNIAGFVKDTAEDVAAAAEAATNASNVNGTSTSSVEVGTASGTATFVMVEADRAIREGMCLKFTNTGTPANFIYGPVFSWDAGTKTVVVTKELVGGSGTLSAWTVSLSGPRGPAGAGTGDVVGPASSVDNRIALFDSTTGKLLKQSGMTLAGAATALSFGGNLTTSGAYASTFTMTGVTTVTFPTTGTLATLAGAEALTGKTYNGLTITTSTGTLTVTNGKTASFTNTMTFAGTDSTTMTFPPASASIGYLDVPSNSQSAAYTTVLADAGKCIDHPASDANARTFTIAANASVAYPVGTCISFSNMTSQVVTIAINSDTMYLAGTGTTGSRSLAQYGVATARKLTSTTWLISGAGLT